MARETSAGPTVVEAVQAYLATVQSARSEHTAHSYRSALRSFQDVLAARWGQPAEKSVHDLPVDGMAWFVAHLKRYAPATERLYLNAVMGFYGYLSAERLTDVTLPQLRQLLKQRGRRPGVRLPQFPADQIEFLLEKLIQGVLLSGDNHDGRLRAMRDRAFLLTLADTGLRVHEACRLRRGDIDWNEGRGVIIGKGDKQAVVRFSSRSMRAMRDYLAARAALDGASGRPLPSLPIFARHDKGAGAKIKPITTTTGRNIVSARVAELLGPEAVTQITPHSFRHYFVTTVLRGSGNLKLAQALARHQNIQVTQRYAHLSDDELDHGYHDIFEASKS